MALWNGKPHAPTPYELVRLRMACKGISGGSFGEWAWHGGKRGKRERDTISGTNLSVLWHILERDATALEMLRTQGNEKEGVTAFDAALEPGRVRQPETIIKVGKPPAAGSALAALAERCAGGAGDKEAEWAITRINGEPWLSFFSSIPSVVGRAINRNAAAVEGYKVFEYGDGQFGVTLRLSANLCRHPKTLLRIG